MFAKLFLETDADDLQADGLKTSYAARTGPGASGPA